MDYNFDRVADRYDATRGFPPGVADQICAWVLSRLPEDPAVAEIGVGTGRIAVPFIQRGVRYTGFDISEQMMARLRAKVDGDLRRGSLYIADVTQPLPVAEASQDAVVAVHIFHLIDAVQAMHQIRRILKPHGALIWGYTDHDPNAPQRRIRPKFNEFAVDHAGEDERYFFVPQARQLLAEWGARVTSHTVASWTGSSTPRRALESIRDKEHSSTWHIPEEAVADALRRTEAWAVAEYGDLDRAYSYEDRFKVDWYQF